MSEIENGGGNNGGDAHGNGGGNGVGAAVSLAALSTGGKHVSAFLLRRMAEAVDGHRGKTVFCRARFTPNAKFDFDVKVEEDVANLEAADDEFGIFGPFSTPEAKGPNLDSTPIRSIVVTLNDGRVIRVDPKKTDALFWTVSAVEKFLIPYYTSVNSVEMASGVLSSFNREGMVFAEHGPNTEPQVVHLANAVPASPDEETPSRTISLDRLKHLAADRKEPTPGLKLVSTLWDLASAKDGLEAGVALKVAELDVVA
jgi:hypothetical protein